MEDFNKIVDAKKEELSRELEKRREDILQSEEQTREDDNRLEQRKKEDAALREHYINEERAKLELDNKPADEIKRLQTDATLEGKRRFEEFKTQRDLEEQVARDLKQLEAEMKPEVDQPSATKPDLTSDYGAKLRSLIENPNATADQVREHRDAYDRAPYLITPAKEPVGPSINSVVQPFVATQAVRPNGKRPFDIDVKGKIEATRKPTVEATHEVENEPSVLDLLIAQRKRMWNKPEDLFTTLSNDPHYEEKKALWDKEKAEREAYRRALAQANPFDDRPLTTDEVKQSEERREHFKAEDMKQIASVSKEDLASTINGMSEAMHSKAVETEEPAAKIGSVNPETGKRPLDINLSKRLWPRDLGALAIFKEVELAAATQGREGIRDFHQATYSGNEEVRVKQAQRHANLSMSGNPKDSFSFIDKNYTNVDGFVKDKLIAINDKTFTNMDEAHKMELPAKPNDPKLKARHAAEEALFKWREAQQMGNNPAEDHENFHAVLMKFEKKKVLETGHDIARRPATATELKVAQHGASLQLVAPKRTLTKQHSLVAQ